MIAMGCFLLAASAGAAAPAEAQRPHILFILADDVGWADTTLYGHTRFYQTPNVERLARRGMVFTRAYAASPLCSPTRAAILTGLSPARTGITAPHCHLPQEMLEARPGKSAPPHVKAIEPVSATRLKTQYRTLAQALKDAGYATGHFGKWHLGPAPYSPLQHGFDVDVPHWPGPGPAGGYIAPWKYRGFDHDPEVPDQHIEDRMAREAVAFMEAHAAAHPERPFFLNYWMFSVHAPFDAKKALIDKHRARVDPGDAQRSPTYAAMIESMDDAVGTLLDALERLGIADRTIVIFASDNGGNAYSEVDGVVPTSNAPLRGGKATVFEGGTRVPCVIVWPGVAAPGARSDAIVQSEDFYPTLLDGLAMAPAPGQRFDGASLLPAIRGGALAREAVFQYFPHSPPVPDWLPAAIAVQSGDWKLIRIFHGGDGGAHRHLLFNLRDDIGEKCDLAPRQAERVRELGARVDRFLADTGAVVPRPNPAFDPAQYRPENEGKPRTRAAQQPKAPAKASGADAIDPRLQGWRARNCTAAVQGGLVTVKATGEAPPFLGVGAGIEGPASVAMRVRCPEGGPGRIEWIPPGAAPNPAHTKAFTIARGPWQSLTIDIPAQGPLGILRIYLPAQAQPVEIDWIEIKSAARSRRWDF